MEQYIASDMHKRYWVFEVMMQRRDKASQGIGRALLHEAHQMLA